MRQGRQGRRGAGDDAAILEIFDDRVGVALRIVVRDIALAAAFDGDRNRAVGNGETIAQACAQVRPAKAVDLLERVADRVQRQQRGLGAEVAGQRLDLLPEFRVGVEVHRGVPVAMQVEHDIRVVREFLQRKALRFKFGARCLPFQSGAHRGADCVAVVVDIVAQLRFDVRLHHRAEVMEVTIEILCGAGFEAADQLTEPMLGQADRV